MLGLGLSLTGGAVTRGGVSPSLDLDFMAGTMPAAVTFTRASAATYFDSAGVLRTQGYNLLTYSNTFTNAAWLKGCSNATTIPALTPAYAAGPDGTMSATRVVLTPPGDAEWALLRVSPITLTAAFHTASVWLKAASAGQVGKKVNLGMFNGSVFPALVQATLTADWQRVVAVGAVHAAAGSTNEFFIGKHRSGNPNGLTNADTATDFLIYGAQLELGASASDYSATTTAANSAPRFDHDPVTLAPRGLLVEEARTNSIRNSSMGGAVAGTPGTAPTNWSIAATSGGVSRTITGVGVEDGIPYIDVRFTGTDGAYGDISFDAGTITAASGQAWTLSTYVRLIAGSWANINASSLILYGVPGFTDNGFVSIKTATGAALKTQRVAIARTFADATTTSASPRLSISPGAGAIDITLRIGAPQLEAGAFATSPILTTAAATRAADVANITSLAGWYNADQGTLMAEYMVNAVKPAGNQVAAHLDDGATNVNRVGIFATGSTGLINFAITTAGGAQNSQAMGAPVAGTVYKTAGAWAANDAMASTNGVLTAADTSIAVPTVTQLRIGQRGQDQLNGHVRKIRYWRVRRPNSDLQQITAI